MASWRKFPRGPRTPFVPGRHDHPRPVRSLSFGNRLSVVASLSSGGSISKVKTCCKRGSARPAELGDHALPVSFDELLLVAPDVVDVDLVEAEVYVVLDVFQMLVEVCGGEDPISEVVYVDQLRHRREVLGVTYVGLRERHTTVGPLAHGLLLGRLLVLRPRDVQLYHARHESGVLALLARPLLEALHEHLDLLVRRTHRDDPVAVPTRPLALDRAGGRDVDRGRRLGHRVEPRALQLDVLPRILDDLAREQLADDLYGLHQDAQPHGCLRPVVADDVLVERLTSPESEPEATRVHGLQRSRGLGDDRRVIAKTRRGHAGAGAEARGGPQGAEPGPYEGALALLGGPGVEVVRGHDRGEAVVLRHLAPPE